MRTGLLGAMLVGVTLLLPSGSHAEEDRLEERVNRDSWFQQEATDQRRSAFRQVVEELSSPRYGGRLPGTEGGRLASRYIADQFKTIGLAPAGDQGSYLQSVALTSMRSAAVLQYTGAGANPMKQSTRLSPKAIDSAEYVAWTHLRKAQQTVQGNAVFVGYGVQAPEFGWDDYHELDVRGRIVVMLTGDPPVMSPDNPGKLDPRRFDGAAMTRHGRWNFKLALAAHLGARAAVLIHDTRAAGYSFSAVKNTFGRQRIYLADHAQSPEEPDLSIWASGSAFDAMLDGSSWQLKDLKQAALGPMQPPVELPVSLTVQIETQWEDFESHNVVAQLPPSPSTADSPALAEPLRPVVLMAHWDHLGPVADRERHSGSYYPGAADNASGIAQMFDVARKLTSVNTRSRPIEFVALTAEEPGLLGARHYIRDRLEHPDRPLPVAGINIDIANVFGRARDIEVIGLGLSALDQPLAEVARDMQRQVSPDYAPNIGRLFRSDQYEFIRHGVPALWIRGGRQPRSFLMRGPITQIKRYLNSGYHQQGDTLQDWWNIDSALEDGNLIAAFTTRLSNESASLGFMAGSPYERSPRTPAAVVR